MALTATATQGFERIGYVERGQVLWVPGDPGDTFTRGDAVTFTATEGVADAAAAGEDVYGIVAETTICTSATTKGFPKLTQGQDAAWGQIDTDSSKTLIPIYPMVPVGTPIERCTFSDQTDDTVTSWTPSTRSLAVTAVATNNHNIGGLLYVYDGPGVGQWSVVESSTASTNLLVLHRIFDTVPTSASSVIYMPGAASTAGSPSFFGRVDLKTKSTLDVSITPAGLDWTVFLDARDAAGYLKNLTLPVIPSGALLLA